MCSEKTHGSFLLKTKLRQTSLYDFHKYYGAIISFLLITTQCTWTPEVSTLIHTSEKGKVSLESSGAFKTRPQHPHIISGTQIKEIFQGILQTQDHGLLQKLVTASPKPVPVFSSAQIKFLTPNIVDALSKATPEELITFQVVGKKEVSSPTRGAIAIFPPTIFFLTILDNQTHSRPSKANLSSRHLQHHTRLVFSQEQAFLKPEQSKQFMNNSPKDKWIAIDYGALNPLSEMDQKKEGKKHPQTGITTQAETLPPEMKKLQEKLLDLQNKVDEQTKKIRRLQQTSPK